MSSGENIVTRAVRDIRGLNDQLERQRRKGRELEQNDVVLDNERRLLLRSPDGNYWSITISNAGALIATNVGPDAL